MRDIVHWLTFLAPEISRRQFESRAGWAWCGPLEKDDEDAEAGTNCRLSQGPNDCRRPLHAWYLAREACSTRYISADG